MNNELSKIHDFLDKHEWELVEIDGYDVWRCKCGKERQIFSAKNYEKIVADMSKNLARREDEELMRLYEASETKTGA